MLCRFRHQLRHGLLDHLEHRRGLTGHWASLRVVKQAVDLGENRTDGCDLFVEGGLERRRRRFLVAFRDGQEMAIAAR